MKAPENVQTPGFLLILPGLLRAAQRFPQRSPQDPGTYSALILRLTDRPRPVLICQNLKDILAMITQDLHARRPGQVSPVEEQHVGLPRLELGAVHNDNTPITDRSARKGDGDFAQTRVPFESLRDRDLGIGQDETL